jgi:hypothetical protein
MDKAIETIRNPRKLLIKLIEGLSIEQLNEVPPGFNNNIIWNMGHIITAQQGVCYRRCGLDLKIDDDFFQRYKPDTKPEGFIDSIGVEKITTLLFTTLDELEVDYNAGIFTNYPTFITRYGIEINSIDSAISFLPFHEGLHIGCMVALKKLVS